MTISKRVRQGNRRVRALSAAIASVGVLSGAAHAFQFDTGNPDLEVRWDNNFKYNAMMRVEDQSSDLLKGRNTGDVPGYSPLLGGLTDDTNLAFDQWDVVSNRFDILSELEVVWKRNFGFRVSGAGWYDFAYGDESSHPGYNKTLFQSYPASDPRNGRYADTWGLISGKPGEYSNNTEDYMYKGGELLDAFVFGSFNVGDMEASVRAGRHTLFWGQSLLLSGAVHGVGASMAPIDLNKGFAVPGTEARELFMPTNKLSGSLQINQNVSLNAYYSFEFESHRLPWVGSYFEIAEITTNDAEFLTLLPGQIDPVTKQLVSAPRQGFVQNASEHPEDGEYGISAQIIFPESGWELGLYYLNYHDKGPSGVIGAVDYGQFLSASVAGVNEALLPLIPLIWPSDVPYSEFDRYYGGGYPAWGVGRFKWAYKEDNDLFGLSLSKEIAGISFGFEAVYRKDTPLYYDGAAVLRNVENYAKLPPVSPLVQLLQGAVDAGLTGFGFDLTKSLDFDGADESNYQGATGDTWHVIVNGLGFLDPGRFWDGGAYIIEATFSSLIDFEKFEERAEPRIREDSLCTTIAVNFTPQWYQVIPSLDMKMPLSISYAISGDQAPIANGGNEGIGNGSAGLSFEYAQAWTIDFKYSFIFGSSDNGPVGNIADHDNISLTVKRTF